MKFSKAIAGAVGVALSAALLPASALALQPADADLTGASEAKAASALTVQASKAAKNRAAHKAYKKKLKKLKGEGMSFGQNCFMDVTGDGVDEMISYWWPAVYTYKSGKVKRVFNADHGSVAIVKAYKKKKVIVTKSPDHLGASTTSYLKWNGSKFAYKVSLYTPSSSGKEFGNQSNYYINGKGKVSKIAAKAYAKKLVGNAKATKITYKSL